MPLIEDYFIIWMPTFMEKRYDKTSEVKSLWRCLCCVHFCKCCNKSARCKRHCGINCCKKSEEGERHTKKTTLFGYKNLYSGADFEIHFKYAYMLTITWVTFLFAPGMPILFPIALIGLLLLYTTNQYMLAKQCKKPPVYDETMTKTTLKVLKIAPYLYAMMGAWLYSN
mgnify:CR=1 FL=1